METTEVLIKIRKIIRSLDIESKKIQREYGISIPQLLCLNYLHRQTNFQTSQGEIRKFMNLNSSTVSGIIDRLEKKGLVARLPRSGDRRVVNIALTSAGDQLLSKAPLLLHEQLSEKLNRINDAELRTIQTGLDTLIGLLDIQEVDASPLMTLNID